MSGVSSWVPQMNLSWVSSKFSVDTECGDYLTDPLVQSICETVTGIIVVAGLVSLVAGVIFSSMTFGVAGFVAAALGGTNYLYVTNYGKLFEKLTVEKSAAASAVEISQSAETFKTQVTELTTQIAALQSEKTLVNQENGALLAQNGALSTTVSDLTTQLSAVSAEIESLRGVVTGTQQMSQEGRAVTDEIVSSAQNLEAATSALTEDVSKDAKLEEALDNILVRMEAVASGVVNQSSVLASYLTLQQSIKSCSEEERVKLFAILPSLEELI